MTEEVFLPRHSSLSRIQVNTVLSSMFFKKAICGGFMGLGVALHDKPLLKYNYLMKYTLGSFALSLLYFGLNEINTGFLLRNHKREQYFFSHGTACIVTVFLLTGIRSKIKYLEHYYKEMVSIAFLQSWKWIGTLSSAAML